MIIFNWSSLTKLDCDIALQFIFKAHSLHAGDGFDHRRFTVGYMTDCANVDCCLARDYLGRKRRQIADFLQMSWKQKQC